MAIGLFVIYACITVIRQIIEPKLVANQLGLPAFLTITAMFFGSQIFGVIGIFILPLTIVMIKILNDEGIIHIFHYSKENEGDDTK
jgi:predicted PurR-regulated permease PerM